MTTEDFIREHRTDDIRRLALWGDKYPDVDMPYALDQIAGWQKARVKLPFWASHDGIVYPPHISMEQCSSDSTAKYKAEIMKRLLSGKSSSSDASLFVDLTGGFGVDFSYLSACFRHAVYVERQKHLCEAASHNFQILGLSHVEVVCDDGVEYLHRLTSSSLIFMDPARRDEHGAKVYGIGDCTPNVLSLEDELLQKSEYVVLKLSPMLDISAALHELGPSHVSEIHVVSVDNECKELLFVLQAEAVQTVTIYCVNNSQVFRYLLDESSLHPDFLMPSQLSDIRYLYEPNASIMKAGCFDILQSEFSVQALTGNSHLFVSRELQSDFPGRTFIVESVSSLNKKEVKQKLGDLRQANISVRNFPIKVEELKKRLKISDGGSTYLFATTLEGKKHVLFRCMKG
jgi:16S rRNA G966 N2-methylase RsmD